MIIAVLQDKGGAGKTTITINVGKAIEMRGFKVLIADSDTQASARNWNTQNDSSVLDVIGLDRPTLDKDIRKFSRDYDYVFIDGGRSLSEVTVKAILCADVVLIPVTPSPYDFWATANLVELVKQRQAITNDKLKAAFIISRRQPNTNIGRDIRKVLKKLDLPVLKNGTFFRTGYNDTASLGQTVVQHEKKYPKASKEINLLADEIMEFANVDK